MKKILILIIVLFIAACTGSKFYNQNVSYLYNPSEVSYIPDYIAFNNSDSLTTIYFKVNTKNLLYVKNEMGSNFEAKFSIQAELYESYETKTMVDSCYKEFHHYDNTFDNDYWGSFTIKAKFPNNYLLKIMFHDMNKHYEIESFVDIYKQERYNSQSFLLLAADSFPLVENYIHESQNVRLFCSDTTIKKLFVRYYNRSFPIALPPFSTFNQKPFNFSYDSIFSIDLQSGLSSPLNLTANGIYHFQVDSSWKQGYSLFLFDNDYPLVSSPLQMLYSLRYLCSKTEYDDLLVMKNKKEAVEKFWLEMGGNAQRAKELIKLYYNRVQEANRLFTSYLEGWKTDRGIIYIVYGPPNKVYKSENTENWIYGDIHNMLSITFTFSKVKNPFTENDYLLSRSPLYKDGWYVAVDNWRR